MGIVELVAEGRKKILSNIYREPGKMDYRGV